MPKAEFLAYVRENRLSNPPSSTGKIRHIRQRVLGNPRCIGITESRLESFCDVKIRDEEGTCITLLDIIFVGEEEVYFVEVKESKTGLYSHNTGEKLQDAYQIVKRRFSLSPTVITAYMDGNRIKTRQMHRALEDLT